MSKIKSSFKASAEGWTIAGDAQSSGWTETGGNPGGYFAWVDAVTGTYAYFNAPPKFLGHLSKFFDGSLSYDVFDTAGEITGKPDVQLVGGNGTTLVAVVGQAGASWTHESVSLGAGAWHVGTIGGTLATEQQIKDVLADVDQMLIRAEYHSGAEHGGIDNVLLKSPPKHATLDPSVFAAHADLAGVGALPAHLHGQLEAAHLAIV